jgi:uncharacterized membrane protein
VFAHPDRKLREGEYDMDKIALADLNSFASNGMQADFVPPSEQLITLTYGQLQDLIVQAVQVAVQPLPDEVSRLQATVASQQEEMAALRAQVRSLESLQEQDITRLACDIAQDRRRLAALESVEPQPMQKDRAEILRALLVANGGKLLAKDVRRKMHLPENRFSELLKRCDFVEVKPLHSDKRKLIIILKSELLPRN